MHLPLHVSFHPPHLRSSHGGGRSVAVGCPEPLRAQSQTAAPAYSYPMGFPGRPLGDGLLVRHGYATENTWYNPG